MESPEYKKGDKKGSKRFRTEKLELSKEREAELVAKGFAKYCDKDGNIVTEKGPEALTLEEDPKKTTKAKILAYAEENHIQISDEEAELTKAEMIALVKDKKANLDLAKGKESGPIKMGVSQ